MRQTKQKRTVNAPVWCVAATLIVGGILVSDRYVDDARERAVSVSATDPSLVSHDESIEDEARHLEQIDPFEQIESTLAMAGCPGWMVLASEGEAALRQPEEPLRVVPAEIKPTALHVTQNVPRVKYPAPVRVASRFLFTPSVESGTALAVGAPDDPDDLLDGTADLLSRPVATQNRASVPAQAPEVPMPVAVPVAPPAVEPRAPKKLIFDAPVSPSPLEQIAPGPQVAPSAPAPHTVSVTPTPNNSPNKSQKNYCEFIAESLYPSAEACAKCHQKIYDEWSVSSHAYAAVSPMFHKFEQKINDLSQGTVGYFCYRCHTPVGVSLGVSRVAPIWSLPLAAREGVTCVACHRVNERYGKVNGDRRIVPGDIHALVYGSIGGGGVAEVLARRGEFKVKTSPHDQGPGQDIHIEGRYFDQLGKSEFCVSCHQVAVHAGIKLEVVWEQYRASPACKKGISCQDCHMGRIPGVPSGYEVGAAAEVAGKVVNNHRKHANHSFYGPGYSIAHPGIFPHNPKARRWTMPDWLLFDYRAGWGTDEFEDRLDAGQVQAYFPPVWADLDDRYDARDIINDNFKKLDGKRISRHQILENGSHVDGPYFDTPLTRGRDLRFHYIMTNISEGHNLPTGSLGAQPQLWANVVLIGPRGQRLWETGYTDRWGDVADIHSADVRNKRIPYDWQLFNLQTMFLITGAKGTDREFFLPVNLDIDQLPYLRPGAQPISVINHPPFIRMEGRSLAALGSRKIPYKVPAQLLREPGRYRLSFRLRSRMEPIYFMRFVGSTREMDRAMNEGIANFHQSTV